MSQLEGSQKLLEARCRNAVDTLIARYGSQLLERQIFVQQTLNNLQAGIANIPYQAAMWTYSCALYDACSGMEGKERQELAYAELFRQLYDRAFWHYRTICADVTQQAIERIFARFEHVRQPGTFLAFAFQQLRDAARAMQRAEKSPTISLESPVGEGKDTLGMLLADLDQRDPGQQLLVEEQRLQLEKLIKEFMQRHPRAKQQMAALLLKHLEGLDEEAISQRLGKPPSSIYVLRHRAIQKIKQMPTWRAFALELGITVDEESKD